MTIETNPPPSTQGLEAFAQATGFPLPPGYLNFMSGSNGARLTGIEKDLELWPLDELVEINADYGVDEFYPGLFLIGTYGVGEACAVEKTTGHLYMTPFIGDSGEDAVQIGETFADLLTFLDTPY
ncbi:SMI1/KNR4 family protein [Hymenobacter busanensis]|uniref:SMI1/KNR4 family protein n=1 Tax=Hymenobacter busanensis TaxID=2607656 RepID=A0A7L4ZU23_9BACT|nr:SMI1/KNR4 family protein [Hymenobacter busanensis]KAA9339758.1 SMI1/KNR4 family protein [Hymenobacter busanensis]QHJ06487.1 hypothetical protein GUY19_03900 [Hymenobacter busanensis]